jgi:predicted glutamine amidotransferase
MPTSARHGHGAHHGIVSAMCELFCLSSRHLTRATFSLRHFAAHGAPNTRNIDSWGVAFHDGRDGATPSDVRAMARC